MNPHEGNCRYLLFILLWCPHVFFFLLFLHFFSSFVCVFYNETSNSWPFPLVGSIALWSSLSLLLCRLLVWPVREGNNNKKKKTTKRKSSSSSSSIFLSILIPGWPAAGGCPGAWAETLLVQVGLALVGGTIFPPNCWKKKITLFYIYLFFFLFFKTFSWSFHRYMLCLYTRDLRQQEEV